MLGTKAGIKLRAKVGQANRLMNFTVNLAQECRGLDASFGGHRYQCVHALAAMCELAPADVLTHNKRMQWRSLPTERMFQLACCRYPVRPKFQYFQQLPENIQKAEVPRTYWVLSDEAKNLQVKSLWGKVSKGHLMHQQVMPRLLRLQALVRQC